VSGVRTFFRHCPSCGRRFEIRLVSKKEVENEAEYRKTAEKPIAPYSPQVKDSITFSGVPLSEGKPAIAVVPEIEDAKSMRYDFRCSHCGHEWSENRTEIREVRPSPEYKGD